MLNLCVFVKDTHHVSHPFTSPQKVLHSYEVLDKFNVAFMEELEQFELQVGVIEHSDRPFPLK